MLDKVSDLKTLEDRPPASEEALRRRADRDLGRLADAAHSLGYWDAGFAYRVDTAAEPQKVTVTVTPGPLYHVASVTVLGPDGKPLAVPPGRGAAAAEPGAPARTAPVLATETALLDRFRRQRPSLCQGRAAGSVVIDHAAHTMAVTYMIAPGRRRALARWRSRG